MIGFVCKGLIKPQTVICLYRMVDALNEKSYRHNLTIRDGGALHDNRALIAKSAIERGCTHLLFVDSDMSFERDAVIKLLERDKDVIGVNYNLRKHPPTTTVKMDEERKKRIKEECPDGLSKCNGLGTGFLLIKTSVFPKLTTPWFSFETSDNGDTTVGEDYWFCRKVKEAGIDIWVDLSISIKHIGDYLY